MNKIKDIVPKKMNFLKRTKHNVSHNSNYKYETSFQRHASKEGSVNKPYTSKLNEINV